MEGHLDCWLGRLKETLCVVSEGRDLWNIWWGDVEVRKEVCVRGIDYSTR